MTYKNYVMQVNDSKKFTAMLNYKASVPNLQATDWIFYIAEPPAHDGNKGITVKFDRASKRVPDLRQPERNVVLCRFPANKETRKGVELKIKYEGLLVKRELVEEPNKGRKIILSKELTHRYLVPTEIVDFDSEDFRNWVIKMKLSRGQKEDPIAYGRRVFSYIYNNYEYFYDPSGNNREASVVCKMKKSDCGGLSNLFTAIMRLHEIPSRTIAGRWADSEDGSLLGGIPYKQWHVKAEFFANGVGWIPVDCSCAVGNPQNPDWFFGNDNGNFITMHYDNNLRVNTFYWGETEYRTMQGVVFWVRGDGNMNDLKIDESWTVK